MQKAPHKEVFPQKAIGLFVIGVNGVPHHGTADGPARKNKQNIHLCKGTRRAVSPFARDKKARKDGPFFM